jgi:nucleotide-binding universal stress UspA family protein
MITLKRILVATDFGEAADAALTYGGELARTFDAKLDVLHVVENVFARAIGVEGYMGAYSEIQRDLEDAARNQFHRLLTDVDRALPDARAVIRTSNSPALEIVTYARDANVDPIVMGTHGRGAMAQLLMGSVAERAVRTAPCPVLTVGHLRREFVRLNGSVASATA